MENKEIEQVKQEEVTRLVGILLDFCAGYEQDMIDEMVKQMRGCDIRSWLIIGQKLAFLQENTETDEVA